MRQTIYEEIQRINLLSKYNSSKTLNENKEIIFEQETTPGGIAQKAVDKIIAISKKNKEGFRGSYLKPSQFQEIDALFGKDTYTKFFYNGGKEVLLGEKIFKKQTTPEESESTQSPYSNFPCVTNHLKAVERKTPSGALAYNINGVDYYDNGMKRLTDKTEAKYTCNDPEFKTKTAAKPVEIPKVLKDANGVKLFQDWMDNNVSNWAEGYKDGKLNQGKENPGFKSGGYGKFGPRTKAAWDKNKNKDQYLNSLKTPATATQTAPGPDDDIVEP